MHHLLEAGAVTLLRPRLRDGVDSEWDDDACYQEMRRTVSEATLGSPRGCV